MGVYDKSGEKINFPLNEKAFLARIDEYKKAVQNGDCQLPSVPDFLRFADVTQDELKELLGMLGEKRSAYYERAVAAKRMVSWVNGAMWSSPEWARDKVGRIFLSKQDWGDGNSYAETAPKREAPKSVKILFGDTSKKAKDTK